MITIAITSCGRYNLLKRTIESLSQSIDLSKYEKIMTEDSRDQKHIIKIKEENESGFLQGWKILYTGGSGSDLYSKHYNALKSLYEEIKTPYVFHCEDDQIFKKTDFDYIELSKKILETDSSVGIVQLRDLVKDFGLKKTGIMKSRYYELLTDEIVEYFGYKLIMISKIDSCRGFSLQPGLRRLDEMKEIMFDNNIMKVDEGVWGDKMIAKGLHAIVINPPVFNHINPIFNSTKTIKNQGLFIWLRQTISGTVTYRSRLLCAYMKNIFGDKLLFIGSFLSISILQPLRFFVYKLGLFGMGYGYGINSLGHAKVLGYKMLGYNNKKPFIFFDIGANIGQTIDEMKKYSLKNISIYSFEPQDSAFEQLKKKESNSVKVFNIGFSHTVGLGTIGLDGENDTGGSIHQIKEYTQEIVLDTIDNFCKMHKIEYISYAKLDIEGAEYDALKGATKMITSGKLEAIEFEFLWQNTYSRHFFKDFWDLLSPYYTIYRVLPRGIYKIKKYTHLLEIYCLSNFLCIKK